MMMSSLSCLSSSSLRGQERSKEGRPRVAVNSLTGRLPGGRKPGVRPPLFARGPAVQAPGRAQLQVGFESQSHGFRGGERVFAQ